MKDQALLQLINNSISPKSESRILCADVTSDYYLKVQVKGLDTLPKDISAQFDSKFELINEQISDLRIEINRKAMIK